MNDSHQADSGLDYFVLDVFSATRLAGNPLAVVIDPGTLTTETMQAHGDKSEPISFRNIWIRELN